MNSEFNEKLFNELPVVAILRFFRKDEVEKLVPASLEGGLRNLEVTMNTPGAAELIRLTCKLVGNQGNVGAGTVTTLEELEQALAAGASFIVTPAVLPDVIQACVKRKVPVMPGAMTPTEVLTAWRLGAKIVKIFPADQLGPGHLKALKAPFPQIPLMPTGGVTVETLPEFKKAGADAFGVGGSMFDPKQVAAGNWEFFREQAARFVRAYTGSADLIQREIELRRRIEYLDAGHGACWLRRPEIAALVEGALRYFDGQRYRLLAWCVMPNHVHTLIRSDRKVY